MKAKTRVIKLETTRRAGGMSWKDFVTGRVKVEDSTWRAFLAAVDFEQTEKNTMDNGFLSWEETQVQELCGAVLVLNGYSYTCDCQAGHAGAHVCTGIKTARNVIDGFEWQTDAAGVLLLTMPAGVAAVVFGAER